MSDEPLHVTSLERDSDADESDRATTNADVGRRTPRRGLVHERTTGIVLSGFYAVYDGLGYGMPESVYAAALAQELTGRGLRVVREALVDVRYRGQLVGRLRLDMMVDDLVVLELKAGPILDPCATRQLYNYLRCGSCDVGLLLYFGPEPQFKRLVYTRRR